MISVSWAPIGGAYSDDVGMARILLVDDNALLRATLARHLHRLGHEVEEAADGVDALARVEEDARFEVVLLDLEMPRMNGREMHERLSSRFPALARRTIVVTGSMLDETTQAWIDREVGGRLLSKPVPIDALLRAIDGVCAH